MIKKSGILIFIFMFCLWGVRCDAQSQYSATLTRMEKSLFGVDYGTQSDDARLKRIEEVVYGSASSSRPTNQRVDKLSKDLSADLIGQEIKPKKDTFEDAQDNPKESIPKADSNVNYPNVDSLEKSVFSKVFKTVEINQRLSNLEQKVFQKTYSDDLSTRVERLQAAVMPQRMANKDTSDDEDDSDSYGSNSNSYNPSNSSMMDQTSQFQDDAYGTQGYDTPIIPQYNANNSVLDSYQGDSSISIPLGSLEKTVLRRTFPNDTISNRLTRLEMKVFNSSFTDDDAQTRFDRIASAYQAQKTSKRYDNNKFSQHAATAMQVGAILLMIIAAIL